MISGKTEKIETKRLKELLLAKKNLRNPYVLLGPESWGRGPRRKGAQIIAKQTPTFAEGWPSSNFGGRKNVKKRLVKLMFSNGLEIRSITWGPTAGPDKLKC